MDLPGMKLAPEGAPTETLDAIPGLPPDLRAFLEQHDGGRGKVGNRPLILWSAEEIPRAAATKDSVLAGFSSSGPTEGPRRMATSRGCGIIGTAASR